MNIDLTPELAARLGASYASTLPQASTVTMNRDSLDNLPIFDQDYIATMSRFLDASSVGTNGVTLVVDVVEATRAGISSRVESLRIGVLADALHAPLCAEARTALAAAGIDTVGKLADTSSAELAQKLTAAGVQTSAADVAGWKGTARTLTHLR